MGLLDKFRSQWDQRRQKKGASKKHVVTPADAAKAAFKAVPAAGQPAAKGPAKGDAPKKRERRSATGAAHRVLLRPLVTEKSTRLQGQQKYSFAVDRDANKVEIRRAVRALYGVDPIRVNVQNLDGKVVRYGRSVGRTAAWRKAIVTLKSGQKIDVLE